MHVSIKSFNVNMEVKSSGLELEVRQPGPEGEFLGDCHVTMTGLVWCNGKTDKKNGKKISWNDFIALMNDPKSLDVALKMAKKK